MTMYYQPTPYTIFRETDGKGIALNLKTEQYYTMNEMGARMWDLLQEKDSLEDIIAAIQAEYDVTHDKVVSDLELFLAELRSSGLIELVER